MTRFIVKNKHQDMRYDKIGLHSLDIDIILGPIDDIVGTRESHVPKSPNMHAAYYVGLRCPLWLCVCVLSLLSLIGAYDLKLCKFLIPSSFNNYDFTTRSPPSFC